MFLFQTDFDSLVFAEDLLIFRGKFQQITKQYSFTVHALIFVVWSDVNPL